MGTKPIGVLRDRTRNQRKETILLNERAVPRFHRVGLSRDPKSGFKFSPLITIHSQVYFAFLRTV